MVRTKYKRTKFSSLEEKMKLFETIHIDLNGVPSTYKNYVSVTIPKLGIDEYRTQYWSFNVGFNYFVEDLVEEINRSTEGLTKNIVIKYFWGERKWRITKKAIIIRRMNGKVENFKCEKVKFGERKTKQWRCKLIKYADDVGKEVTGKELTSFRKLLK